MSIEQQKEKTMKKLAIIGIAVLGLTLTIAVSEAGANPGLSKSEFRALMLRSEGLNQKYGIDVQVKSENPDARAQQSGLGVQFKSENPHARGAVAPKQATPKQAEYRALLLRSEGLNQKYGIDAVRGGENARSVPVSVPATFASPSNSTEFKWGEAVIGAAALIALMAIVAGLLVTRRDRFRLGTS
jgi:hypothetical protein